MTITITAFARSPDQGRGLARDFRVRWALEEAGLAYRVEALSFDALKSPEARARQPFGQIPSYQDHEVKLFESGAILLHIAARTPILLPDSPAPRARALQWVFAALNTVELPIYEREVACFLEGDKPWHAERLAAIDGRISRRLEPIAERLADRAWLEESFTVGDLAMVTLLRRLEGPGLLDRWPALTAYVTRAKDRPAYQRAFDAQYRQWAAGAVAHPVGKQRDLGSSPG